jgi:hypothetical protein
MQTQDYSNRLALSRVEAAELLGLSAVTIDRLTKRGLLRPSRDTRRPIYAVAELPSSSRGASGIGGTCRREEVKNHGETH